MDVRMSIGILGTFGTKSVEFEHTKQVRLATLCKVMQAYIA